MLKECWMRRVWGCGGSWRTEVKPLQALHCRLRLRPQALVPVLEVLAWQVSCRPQALLLLLLVTGQRRQHWLLLPSLLPSRAHSHLVRLLVPQRQRQLVLWQLRWLL